jgi:quercetin dioxygenase-like cupin family protein
MTMESESNPQLSNLPTPTRLITTHDSSGKAILHSAEPFAWQNLDNNQMSFSLLYSTTFPASLAPTASSPSGADIAAHTALLAQNPGLVHPSGTLLRTVDFAPSYTCAMHRTLSLDYGIVLEGTLDMLLDSGETKRVTRGDVVVQRATMHAWRNASETEWARMVFVLQDVQRLEVCGVQVGEELGTAGVFLPGSGN